MTNIFAPLKTMTEIVKHDRETNSQKIKYNINKAETARFFSYLRNHSFHKYLQLHEYSFTVWLQFYLHNTETCSGHAKH